MANPCPRSRPRRASWFTLDRFDGVGEAIDARVLTVKSVLERFLAGDPVWRRPEVLGRAGDNLYAAARELQDLESDE